MNILVIHALFGLTWDELASIGGIIAAIFAFIGWIIHASGKKAGNFINENVHKPLSSVDTNMKGLGNSVDSLREELHRHAVNSSETLIKMQDRDNNFESRISYLEKIVGKFLKEKL